MLGVGVAVALSATVVFSRLQGGSDLIDYEVGGEYPHDPNAFTQGLYFEDGFLYEGTGRRGQSSLRKVELETGTVLADVALPGEFFGEGIAPLGDRIYQLTWTSGVAFIYDKESFEVQSQVRYSREGWGLTGDGTHLVMSDGSEYLYFLDPESFGLVRQVEVRGALGPVRQLNELEYIEGYIYANVWYTHEILKIAPESGDIVGRLDLTDLVDNVEVSDPEGVLNGIAYDPESGRMFVTGKLWPKLFELRLR